MLGIELWSSYMLGKSPPELHPQPGFERGSEVEPRNAIASRSCKRLGSTFCPLAFRNRSSPVRLTLDF